MQEREPIVMTWEEWQRSREQKRMNLRAAGLAAPSRRAHGVGKADQRLRVAFGGERVPTFVPSSSS